MDAYALPTYFPLAYSELQFLASRRAAAMAAAATVLPPLLPHQSDVGNVSNRSAVEMTTANTNVSSLANRSESNSNNSTTPCNVAPTQGLTHEFHPAYRIPGYMEQFYSLQRTSPTTNYDPYGNCAPPPFHLAGLSLGSSEYLGGRGVTSLNELHPAAVFNAGSLASTDFHFSIDGRLNSPRSVGGGGTIRTSVSRKRALSSSPYSDSFDINSMIRFSPNSLQTLMNGSRASSAASGSYGHLSAGALSPMTHSAMAPHIQQLQAHLLRASAGLLHPLPSHQAVTSAAATATMFSMNHVHSLQSAVAAAVSTNSSSGDINAVGIGSSNGVNEIKTYGATDTNNFSTTSCPHKNNLIQNTALEKTIYIEQPSSTSNDVAQVEADSASANVREHHRHRCKSVLTNKSINQTQVQCAATTTTTSTSDYDCPTVDTTDIKDEPGDFIETNCHWRACGIEFMTQDELVKHINNDHIQTNKKAFICRWANCSRGEKPFKAQYMLVVHMRRHTGEKPHKSNFK